MGEEKRLSVPLAPKTFTALDRAAKANGRNLGREAAAIIGRALSPSYSLPGFQSARHGAGRQMRKGDRS